MNIEKKESDLEGKWKFILALTSNQTDLCRTKLEFECALNAFLNQISKKYLFIFITS